MWNATSENILQHFASKFSKKGFCIAIAHVNHVRLRSLQFGIRYTVYYTFLFKYIPPRREMNGLIQITFLS